MTALGMKPVAAGTSLHGGRRINDDVETLISASSVKADRALVNRMGFNNDGADAVLQRLLRHRTEKGTDRPIGVNMAANARYMVLVIHTSSIKQSYIYFNIFFLMIMRKYSPLSIENTNE